MDRRRLKKLVRRKMLRSLRLKGLPPGEVRGLRRAIKTTNYIIRYIDDFKNKKCYTVYYVKHYYVKNSNKGGFFYDGSYMDINDG